MRPYCGSGGHSRNRSALIGSSSGQAGVTSHSAFTTVKKSDRPRLRKSRRTPGFVRKTCEARPAAAIGTPPLAAPVKHSFAPATSTSIRSRFGTPDQSISQDFGDSADMEQSEYHHGSPSRPENAMGLTRRFSDQASSPAAVQGPKLRERAWRVLAGSQNPRVSRLFRQHLHGPHGKANTVWRIQNRGSRRRNRGRSSPHTVWRMPGLGIQEMDAPKFA
jgi:hypothetical protein